jgi:hypothetical protein
MSRSNTIVEQAYVLLDRLAEHHPGGLPTLLAAPATELRASLDSLTKLRASMTPRVEEHVFRREFLTTPTPPNVCICGRPNMERRDHCGASLCRREQVCRRAHDMATANIRQEGYYVVETACHPNAWKVTSDKFRDDNSPSHYFPEESLAEAEAKRRNDRMKEEQQHVDG